MRSPFILLGCALVILSACGGGGGKSNPDLHIQLSLDPMSSSLNSGESRTYVANVRIPGAGVNLMDDARFGIEWSVTGGYLASVPGQDIAWKTYTAPSGAGTYQVNLRSTYNPGTKITATVNVAPPPVATALEPARTSLYQGESVNLVPSFSSGTGMLQPGNVPVTSGVAVSVSPLRTTQYSLVVTNSIGRTATTTCTLSVQARGMFAPLPTWTPFAFEGHAESLLPEGKVLVVAKVPSRDTIKAYKLDPDTWAFTPLAVSPAGIYQRPNSLLLPDGRVLVYGSDISGSYVAEVFNPADESFAHVDTSILAGGLITVLPLGGNTLLFVGYNGVYACQADTLVPGPVTRYPSSFSYGAAVPTSGSRALFFSVYGGPQVFDVSTGVFTSQAAVPWYLWTPATAVRLKNGKIFLAGSQFYYDGGNFTYLLDPETWTFTATDPLLVYRERYTVPVLLNDGRVIVSGPTLETTPTEIYDPALGTSCQLPDLDSMVGASRATVLADGRVLFLGSTTGAVFDPALVPPAPPRMGSFALTGSLKAPRHPGALTLLADGSVLVVGASRCGSAEYQKAVERFDPATGTFQRLGDLKVARMDHSATLLPSGKVLVFGGGGGLGTSDPVAEVYDPATGTSEALDYQDWSRGGNKAVTLTDGRICILNNGLDALRFDPSTSQFTKLGTLSGTGGKISAAVLPDGKVLASTGDLLDPVAGTCTPVGAHAPGALADLVALANGAVLAVTYITAEVYTPAVAAYLPTSGLLHALDTVPPVRLADGTVLLLQGRLTTEPTQIFLPSLNGGLGGFILGPMQAPIHTPCPMGILLGDGRVLVVDAEGCQIYTP